MAACRRPPLIFLLRLSLASALHGPARVVSRRQLALNAPLSAFFLPQLVLAPRSARADDGSAAAQDGRWRFTPGPDFALSPPLVRTHADEVTYKYSGPRASEWKYFKAGLTVDPVRLESIKAFDTPEGVGKRIVQAELAKGGIIEVNLEEAVDDAPFYRLRYVVDTAERGKKRYVARVTVADKKLIVLTCEAYVRYWDEAVEREVQRIVGSLVVRAPGGAGA